MCSEEFHDRFSSLDYTPPPEKLLVIDVDSKTYRVDEEIYDIDRIVKNLTKNAINYVNGKNDRVIEEYEKGRKFKIDISNWGLLDHRFERSCVEDFGDGVVFHCYREGRNFRFSGFAQENFTK